MKICYLYINNFLPFSISGWHTRINIDISTANVSFYILVPALQREYRVIELTYRLVSEQQILRDQRTRYRDTKAVFTPCGTATTTNRSQHPIYSESVVRFMVLLVTKHSSFVNIVMNVTCKSCLFCTYFVVIVMNMMEMK
jgi:hypothetical protein